MNMFRCAHPLANKAHTISLVTFLLILHIFTLEMALCNAGYYHSKDCSVFCHLYIVITMHVKCAVEHWSWNLSRFYSRIIDFDIISHFSAFGLNLYVIKLVDDSVEHNTHIPIIVTHTNTDTHNDMLEMKINEIQSWF